MNSSTWHRLTEFCRDREAMAHQRELARRHDWIEESEDGLGGDVDRRMTMFGSLFIYAMTLLVLGVLFFSCRRAAGEETAMGRTGESGIAVSPSRPLAASLLNALAMVESGNNPRAIGRAGEVTEFQFRRETLAEVQMHRRALTQKGPVQDLPSTPPARLAASFHLGKLFQQLTIATGRAPTPPELYAAWNLGFSRFRRNGFSLARCPASTRDAARRTKTIHELETNIQNGSAGRQLCSSEFVRCIRPAKFEREILRFQPPR